MYYQKNLEKIVALNQMIEAGIISLNQDGKILAIDAYQRLKEKIQENSNESD